ncbi:MAG: efflux RND transporter periplasmic adaptor subunit [Acetobacteraceae bacterium]
MGEDLANPTVRRRLTAARVTMAAAVILAIAAGGGALLIRHPEAQQAPQASQPRPAGPIVPVSVSKVERQDVPVWLRGLGTIQPTNAVQIRSRVDGALQDVVVTEGQDVRTGDLLAVIDPRPYQALLDVAVARGKQDQAALDNARSDLARYTMLAQKEIASRQKLESIQMQVSQLTAARGANEALIAAAQLNLTFCYIRAPFDGRVGLRLVDPGNLVRAAEATPMFSLVQIQPIAATFTLPQAMLPALQAAMDRGTLPVVAFSADDKTELDRGTLVTIDNAIDVATGTIKLKATFPNAGNRLWPGQFVNLQVLVGTDDGALVIPTAAVQHGPAGQYVYVVKPDSTVARQPVEVSRDNGRFALIAKGLDEGQTVVVDGQSRLQSGSRVAANDGGSARDSRAAKTGG